MLYLLYKLAWQRLLSPQSQAEVKGCAAVSVFIYFFLLSDESLAVEGTWIRSTWQYITFNEGVQ